MMILTKCVSLLLVFMVSDYCCAAAAAAASRADGDIVMPTIEMSASLLLQTFQVEAQGLVNEYNDSISNQRKDDNDDGCFTSPPTRSPVPGPTYVEVTVHFVVTIDVILEAFFSVWDRTEENMESAINEAVNKVIEETQDMIDLQNDILYDSNVLHTVQRSGVSILTQEIDDIIEPVYEKDLGVEAKPIRDTLNKFPYNQIIAKSRNVADADLVCVLVKLNGMEKGGSSSFPFVHGEPNFSETAFLSVVKIAKAMNRFHFAHEIGHNLGLAHDVEAGNPPGTKQGNKLDNGRGYILRQSDGNNVVGLRTIMAYPHGCGGENDYNLCPRIPRYSNNEKLWFDVATKDWYPTGTPEADNVPNLIKYMPKVAAYR